MLRGPNITGIWHHFPCPRRRPLHFHHLWLPAVRPHQLCTTVGMRMGGLEKPEPLQRHPSAPRHARPLRPRPPRAGDRSESGASRRGTAYRASLVGLLLVSSNKL